MEAIVEGDYAHIIVHEAVEALGNLNDANTLKLLEKYENNRKDIVEIVKETNEVSIALINWNIKTDKGKSEGLDKLKMKFRTNDPAPCFNYKADKQYASIPFLTQMLLDDKNYSMFERYRALFTLREINTVESCEAMC